MTEVCASDLLLLTQRHPGTQSSLNYSAVPMQKELSSTNQTGRTVHKLAALFQSADIWYGISAVHTHTVLNPGQKEKKGKKITLISKSHSKTPPHVSASLLERRKTTWTLWWLSASVPTCQSTPGSAWPCPSTGDTRRNYLLPRRECCWNSSAGETLWLVTRFVSDNAGARLIAFRLSELDRGTIPPPRPTLPTPTSPMGSVESVSLANTEWQQGDSHYGSLTPWQDFFFYFPPKSTGEIKSAFLHLEVGSGICLFLIKTPRLLIGAASA